MALQIAVKLWRLGSVSPTRALIYQGGLYDSTYGETEDNCRPCLFVLVMDDKRAIEY
jgi:hypothetical protein